MRSYQEKAFRNAARIRSCRLHDFDWKKAIADYKARQEKLGVVLGVRPVIMCRCKNCGGKISVLYAGAYMDAVEHMKAIQSQLNG